MYASKRFNTFRGWKNPYPIRKYPKSKNYQYTRFKKSFPTKTFKRFSPGRGKPFRKGFPKFRSFNKGQRSKKNYYRAKKRFKKTKRYF